MTTQATLCVLLLFSVASAGCTETPPPATGDEIATTTQSSSASVAVTATQKATPTPITLLAAGDTPTLRLQATSAQSYRATGADSMALFTIKVEDDRVKVKGAAGDAIGKVKRKDAAFKVYGRDDKVLFKAKRKKDKIKIKGDDGQELGKIKKSTMTWKGQSITSRPDGGKVTIEGPSGPLRVVGVNPDEALWLGIPDLDLSLRLGVVIFLRDIGF